MFCGSAEGVRSQSGVPLAEYVRGRIHEHILQRGAGLRERGAALGAFIKKAHVLQTEEAAKNAKHRIVAWVIVPNL